MKYMLLVCASFIDDHQFINYNIPSLPVLQNGVFVPEYKCSGIEGELNDDGSIEEEIVFAGFSFRPSR